MAGQGGEFDGHDDAGLPFDLFGSVGGSVVFNDAPGSSRFHGADGSSRYHNADEDMGRLDLNAGDAWRGQEYQHYAAHIRGEQEVLPPPVRVPRGGGSRSLGFRPPRHAGVGASGEGDGFDGPAASVGAGFVPPPPPPGSGSSRRRGRGPRARGTGPAIHADNFDGAFVVPNPVDKHKANWTQQNIERFCDAYLAEMQNGNCPGGQMNKFGWKNVARRYFSAAGLLHDREQLQGKLRNLWKIWTFCEKAQNHTGLGIDGDGMIQASEKWWTDNAKGDNDLPKIRRDGVPSYLEQLYGMFKGNTVDGTTSFVPAARDATGFDADDSEDEAAHQQVDDLTPLSVGNKRNSSTSTTASSPSKKSKSPAVRSMSTQMTTHNEISRERLELYRATQSKKNEMMQRLLRDKSWKIAECSRIAQDDLGISPTIRSLFAGLHNLIQSETEMDFFLAQNTPEAKLHVIELNIPNNASVGDDQDGTRQQLLQMIFEDDDDELMEELMNDEEDDEFIHGVPEGVTLLEFEPVIPEEDQEQQEPEDPAGEGVPADDLPECPDHEPSTFLKDDMLYQGFCKTYLHPAGEED